MGIDYLLSLFVTCVVVGQFLGTAEGCVMAIDTSTILYRFCARHALEYLSGDCSKVVADLMHLLDILITSGITPLLVFDGVGYKPKLNGAAIKRAELREKNQKLFDEAESAEDRRRYAARIVRPNQALMNAILERLQEDGISYIIAPREADHQLALLAHEGISHYTLSTDQDMIIYGIFRLITDWRLAANSAKFFSLHGGLNSVVIPDVASPSADAAHAAEAEAADIAHLPPSQSSLLEQILAPLSEPHRLRALRAFAQGTGNDYFKFKGVGKGAAECLRALSLSTLS
jgi:XPG I-region/XPG N-terminal domain